MKWLFEKRFSIVMALAMILAAQEANKGEWIRWVLIVTIGIGLEEIYLRSKK